MRVRDITEDDWDRIAWLASGAAQEGDHSLNVDWVTHRREEGDRRESVIEHNGIVEAYCSIERTDPIEIYRAFIVLDWINFDDAIAQLALNRLEEIIEKEKSSEVWMREMASDRKLISFLKDNGFVEAKRYKVNGYELVNLTKQFGSNAN